MTGSIPKIENWKPHEAGALRGFCDVTLPSGMKLHGCAVLAKDARAWAMPPSRPMVGRDGAALTDQAGKRRYEPCVTFASREAADRFSALVIEALRVQHPEALA